jgi:hypothetical protein
MTDDMVTVRVPRALVDAVREAREGCGCDAHENAICFACSRPAVTLARAILSALPLDVEAGDEEMVEALATVAYDDGAAGAGALSYAVANVSDALLARLATLRAEVARMRAAADVLRAAAWEASRHGGSTTLHNAIAGYDQVTRAALGGGR